VTCVAVVRRSASSEISRQLSAFVPQALLFGGELKIQASDLLSQPCPILRDADATLWANQYPCSHGFTGLFLLPARKAAKPYLGQLRRMGIPRSRRPTPAGLVCQRQGPAPETVNADRPYQGPLRSQRDWLRSVSAAVRGFRDHAAFSPGVRTTGVLVYLERLPRIAALMFGNGVACAQHGDVTWAELAHRTGLPKGPPSSGARRYGTVFAATSPLGLGGTSMPFYQKGDVRIRYEETGPASRFW